jgi:hypothetical protein
MTILINGRLDEQAALIQATAQAALTGAAGDGVWVSLKNYRKATVIVDVTNGATVTGGTVTLKQGTNVAGGNEKALAFSRMKANIDVGASQAMAEVAVVNNAFTTDATNAKRLRYVLEVDSDTLDADNNFDAFRVDVTGMANATGHVQYILWGARYSGANPMVD